MIEDSIYEIERLKKDLDVLFSDESFKKYGRIELKHRGKTYNYFSVYIRGDRYGKYKQSLKLLDSKNRDYIFIDDNTDDPFTNTYLRVKRCYEQIYFNDVFEGLTLLELLLYYEHSSQIRISMGLQLKNDRGYQKHIGVYNGTLKDAPIYRIRTSILDERNSYFINQFDRRQSIWNRDELRQLTRQMSDLKRALYKKNKSRLVAKLAANMNLSVKEYKENPDILKVFAHYENLKNDIQHINNHGLTTVK